MTLILKENKELKREQGRIRVHTKLHPSDNNANGMSLLIKKIKLTCFLDLLISNLC